MKLIDLTGKKFGMLTVVGLRGRDRWGQVDWNCRCDCGAAHRAVGSKLRRGEVKSCGCAKPNLCATANIKHGYAMNRGKNLPPEYGAWMRMIERCERENYKQRKDYGGRGISVCETWRRDFAAFLRDMGPRPSSLYSLDRIDTNGNYEPGNCRWATREQQSQNTRRVRNVTHRGETMCVAAWARAVGIKDTTLFNRLSQGWTVAEALETPVGPAPANGFGRHRGATEYEGG